MGHRLVSMSFDRLGLLREVDGWLWSDVTKWVAGLALVGFVLGVERRPLSSIGFRPPTELPVVGGVVPDLGVGALVGHLGGVLGWSVVGFVGTVVLTTGAYRLYERFELETPEGFVEEQAARGTVSYLITGVSAGVVESVAYQGYLISRVAELSGSVAVAAVFAWVVFTAVHNIGDTFGLAETVYIGVPGLAMVLLYVASESVIVVCVVHTAVNVLSFLSE